MGSFARATSQAPDYLISGSDTLKLFSNPLEDYFRTKPRPEIFDKMCSTACWRGYVSYFRLRNDSLFVENIYSCCDKKTPLSLDLVFTNIDVTKPIFANWVNRALVSPSGEILDYVHMGYMSIYEKETDYTFEHGILKEIQNFSNVNVKDSFKVLDQTTASFQDEIDWSKLPYLATSFRVDIEVQVNTDGKIINKKLLTNQSTEWSNEALRVLDSAPVLPIIIRRGEVIQDKWTLYVWFVPAKRPN